MMARLWTLLIERFTLALLGAAAATALFILIAYQVTAGSTRRLDTATVSFFQAHQTPVLHTLLQGVSLLASGGAQCVAAALCLLACRRPAPRPDAASMLVAIGGGEGLIYGLKALFHRPRPAEVFAHLGYSFPSGHSFFAVTLYGMTGYWLTRPSADGIRRPWVWPCVALLVLLIGFSRVFLGVHYPSDVVAGFLAAAPWLWACLALPRAFRVAFGQRGNR